MENQATKKGLILLLGVVIGLLTGILVAVLVVNKVNPDRSTEVRVIAPETPAVKDTVVKYVIHQYQSAPKFTVNAVDQADSLSADSLYVEGGALDYMLDDEVEPEQLEPTATSVASEKMVARFEAPVLYFDANKNATETPEHAQRTMEVQFWSTPIRNKMVYQFKDNKIKVKGIVLNEANVIHYKDRYYLQSEKRIYLIQPTDEYKRLTEIHDAPFGYQAAVNNNNRP